MAGLVAAARARELGVQPVVYEKGRRTGGSMRISSCVVWRYRAFDDFRAQCPVGDPLLQRCVFDRLDDALRWLESLGAPVVARGTGNPLTSGVRFDPEGLTAALDRAAGDVRLGETAAAVDGTLVVATGGFQGDADLVQQHIRPAAPLPLRANPWSRGDGLRTGLARGAALSSGMDEFYGRNMPDAAVSESDFVRGAQLYARHAFVVNERGEEFLERPPSWSETDVVQATARQPGASAWYVLTDRALEQRVRERRVREMVDAAARLGGTVVRARDLPFAVPEGASVAVRVRASITHTVGGLAVDERARVLDRGGVPISDVFACGVDAGGIAAGGYASGLAAALVFGRIAAEAATA